MKLKPILIGLLICISVSEGLGQHYQSARVTDYFHFIRTKYPFNYPLDYFSDDPEWGRKLIDLADSLIRQRFNLREVNFQMSVVNFHEVDAYAYGSILSPPPVEGFKNIPRNQEDLYIAIFSAFGFSGDVAMNEEDNEVQNLLLKVMVEDKNGKTVYQNKIKAPFYLQPAGYLYDPVLNRKDFQNLYEEALNAVWQDKNKFKKRALNYRHLDIYDDFINECNYYNIKETVKDGNCEILNEKNEQIGALNLSGGSINREFTEEFFGFNMTDRLRQTGRFTNSLVPLSCEFIAGLSINESYDSTNTDPNDALVIFKENNNERGRFNMPGFDLVTGHMNEHNYQLKYIDGLDLCELYMDDEMVGVIQEGKLQKENRKMRQYYNSYFLKSLTKEELGDILNVFIAYQLASKILSEAVDEEMGY